MHKGQPLICSMVTVTVSIYWLKGNEIYGMLKCRKRARSAAQQII